MMHYFSHWGSNWGMNFGWIWGVVLSALVITCIVLLFVFLMRRDKGDHDPHYIMRIQQPLAIHARIMEILKVNFEANLLSFDGYEERRMILEGGQTDDYKNDDLVQLKEQYARVEIDTPEF